MCPCYIYIMEIMQLSGQVQSVLLLSVAKSWSNSVRDCALLFLIVLKAVRILWAKIRRCFISMG